MCSATTATATQRRGRDRSQDLDEALSQMGHFGFYQVYVLFLVCIPNVLGAMYSLNYVFVADQVPFRCAVPECEGNSIIPEILPPANMTCQRYELETEPTNNTCTIDDFNTTYTLTCELFIYENMDTIFAEFNLACREWLRTMVGTVRNFALPLALLLTGYLSDSWGRRTAFCILVFFAGLMGIMKSFSINYQMYVAMEFFEAALGYGFNSALYVIVIELARPSLRASFACATGVAYGVGGMLFALIAWAVPYWRALLRWIHAPALLLTTYWLILDESPRWLHNKNKSDETIKVIKKAARWNKKTIDEEILKKLEIIETTKDLPSGSEAKATVNPWLQLLKSRALVVRFVLCSFCWIASTFVYYGLTINSVSLSGDKYVNFALNMSMEIVASLLIMMALERFGRKKSIFVAFLLCGIACVIPFFVAHTGTGLGLFFLGKMAITFAFNSLYVFTAELFPTATRSSALAACSLVGRIGSILAPQTPLLDLYVQAFLYGGVSLLAAILVLLVPETRRALLPESVEGAERMRAEPASPPAAVSRHSSTRASRLAPRGAAARRNLAPVEGIC